MPGDAHQVPPGGPVSGQAYPTVPGGPASGDAYPAYPGGAQVPPGYPPGPPAPPGYPSSGGYPAYGPGSGGGGKSSRGPLLVALALLVVAAIVAGAVLVLGGGDDDTGELAGGSIRLEPVDSTQPDDFAGNLDLEPLGESIAVALSEVPELEAQVTTGLSGRVAPGTEPGLYGGSQDVGVCHVGNLVEFLTNPEHREEAEAWAEVHDITVDGIEDYVRTLTPLRLRFDTRVTNHGFEDGEATPFQSVLQAGTAVMVDESGVPRVKCNCGNPLLPPQPVSEPDEATALDLEELAENPDEAWDSVLDDPGSVVTVEAGSEPVDELTLVDLDGGRLFRRPVGTNGDDDETVDAGDVGDMCTEFAESPTCQEPDLGSGDVQVTLRWNSSVDLDLHVTEPNGEETYYGDRSSSTGGELDVDANAGCGGDPPVENIFWPEGSAPSGTYTVEVVGFSVSSCGGSSDYTLTVQVGGEVVIDESGTVADGEEDAYTFDA